MSFFDELLNPDTAVQHIEQSSEAWDKIRLGRFTSSMIYKIMECGKRPMTPEELKARPKSGKGSKTTQVPDPSKMSDGGITYIHQKVWETLTGKPVWQAYAYPMVYGKEQEPIAVEFYERKYGVTCEPIGFQVWTDHAGGSPDRIIGDEEGLEIKCPSSDEQIKYLLLNDHYDLKREYPQIYWQCVSLMMFTNRKRWHLSTFDDRMLSDKHKMTRITIEASAVEEDMDQINKALEGAVKEKLQLIQLLS